MRESNYWLKIIKEAKIDNQPVLENLLIESEELKKILGKIASKTRKSI